MYLQLQMVQAPNQDAGQPITGFTHLDPVGGMQKTSQYDPGFQTSERGANAEMRAFAERQVIFFPLGRSSRNSLGLSNCTGSRLAAPHMSNRCDPAGTGTPANVVSVRTWR
jgi:hypothetical protein